MSGKKELRNKRTLASRLADKDCTSKIKKTTNLFSNDSKPFSKPTVQSENLPSSSPRLKESFYNQTCIKLAKNLLGKILVRKLDNGEILRGRIVETECYLGGEDKASHSYKNKKTERNEPMFMAAGTAYIYMTYGMYYIFNISSLETGSAVLIRALEPLENLALMGTFRCSKRKSGATCKNKDLCNGPGKLCQALSIEKQTINKLDLCTSEALWVEHGEDIDESNIVICKRIGIDSVGAEWADKPLRFYVRNCPWVSIRNKSAELI